MPRQLPCPAILFTHNVEAEIWRRHVETATNPVARHAARRSSGSACCASSATRSRVSICVLAVSEADGETFERLYPGALRAPVHVVQTGVDTQYFSPLSATPARRAHLVFTGSMDWLPNEDGMLYFVRDILPLVRQAEPGATLSIIGRAPTPAVRKLAEQHGVEVTGQRGRRAAARRGAAASTSCRCGSAAARG